jgi:hypothetical protein
MSGASPFLRPLVEDEIEAVRTIEKRARIRYRDLGGLFVRAAEGPPIAAERFTTGETVVVELDGKPEGFVLLQPLDGCFMSPTYRSAQTLLVWGLGECS